MADPDILRAVEKINRRIASLEEVRNRLAEEFGIQLSAAVPENTTASPVRAQQKHGTVNKTRKDILADYLVVNGPRMRTEIVSSGIMAEGTVSYCLNDKKYFKQLSDGRWDVVNREQPALDLMREAV